MHDDHSQEDSGGIRIAALKFMEKRKDGEAQVAHFAEQLGKVVAFLPANVAMGGGGPGRTLIDIFTECVIKRVIEIVHKLRDVVGELGVSQRLGADDVPVTMNRRRPIRNNPSAGFREEPRQSGSHFAVLRIRDFRRFAV